MGFKSSVNKYLKPLGFQLSEIQTGKADQRRPVTDSKASNYSKRPKNLYTLTAEFSELTDQQIFFMVDAAKRGMFFFKYLLFDELRRPDLHIGGLLQKRKLSILGKLRHSKIEDLILCEWKEGKEFLINTFRQKSIRFPNFLSDILEAQFQGVAIFEKVFRAEGSKLILDRIPLLPGHCYLYDDVNDKYKFLDPLENDVMLNRAAAAGSADEIDMGRLSTIEIAPIKLLEVHGYDGNNPNGFMNGLTDSMIYSNFIKSMGMKDWSIFLEIYGLPPRVGKYDGQMMNMIDGSFDKFCDAVENFGNNYWTVIEKSNDIALLEFNKTGTSDVYKRFIDHIDVKQSVRVLGQNLTTQVTTEGTRAASETHYNVEQDILDSDILLLETTMDELIMDLLKLNFTTIPEEPKFKIPVAKSNSDLETRSRVYVNLDRLGYKATKEQVESEFGFQVVEKPEPTNNNPTNGPAEYTDKIINDIWHTQQ